MGIEPTPSDNGVRAVLARVEKRLDVLTRVLLGNGDVGLAEQVRDNAKEIQALREERANGDMKFWAKVALLATAVGGVMEIVGRLLGG